MKGQRRSPEQIIGKLRDELLNAELFADVREAKALAAAWQSDYNHRRPHSSWVDQTPAAHAATCGLAAADAALGLRPKPRQGRCP